MSIGAIVMVDKEMKFSNWWNREVSKCYVDF